MDENRAAGTARSASDVAGSARVAGSSFERRLRNTIEQQPYTAVAIALGIGRCWVGLTGRCEVASRSR
jgi:hypothetical protein